MDNKSEEIIDKEEVVDSNKGVEYYKYLASVVLPGTRGARFKAAQLLVLKERASLFILSVLTIFLIGMAVALLAGPSTVSEDTTKSIGVLSTVASVAVLALTLFDYAFGRGLLASKLHDSSLRVTELMRYMERELAKENPSIEALERLAEQYEKENISTNVNHAPLDFTLYKISRLKSDYIRINFFYRAYGILAQSFVVAFSVAPGLVTLICVTAYAYKLLF